MLQIHTTEDALLAIRSPVGVFGEALAADQYYLLRCSIAYLRPNGLVRRSPTRSLRFGTATGNCRGRAQRVASGRGTRGALRHVV